jgi:hypothetical protein
MPEPTSVPDHDTGKVALAVVAGSALTLLDGGFASMVLTHAGVTIGASTLNPF